MHVKNAHAEFKRMRLDRDLMEYFEK